MVDYTPFVGSQHITSLAASTALTVPVTAKWALLMPQVQAVHINLGTAATGLPATATTNDMKIAVGTPVEITSDIRDVTVIEAAGGAVLDVWYFA
jgi:hypothetical protein